MAYHTKEIAKGVNGRASKIQEELDELIDAESQKNRIMMLVELSDMIAAIHLYMEENFPDFNIHDLCMMADATISAFKDGTRK